MNRPKIESEDWKQIVIQLRDITEEKGITQAELAEKTGMLQSTVSRLFSLAFVPKLSTVITVAKALDCAIIIKEN